MRFGAMLALLGALAFWARRSFALARSFRSIANGTLHLGIRRLIADLYLRADMRDDTMKYLFVETHQRVLQRLNLPPTASHELIASRLQQTNPHLPKWKKTGTSGLIPVTIPKACPRPGCGFASLAN